MLDRWEPGAEVGAVAALLADLVARTRHLVDVVAGRAVDRSILDRPLPDDARRAIEASVLAGIGFDASAGRVDPSPRAFCLTVGPGDVRITTRLYNTPGLHLLHSSMHEAGHAVYAQRMQRLGVPATIAGPAGLGLDESQSRTMEVLIGQGTAFWAHHYPTVVDAAPDVFAAREEAAFVAAMAAPVVDLLRIDSGEAAYNLHVVLRMRLERALVNGDMEVAELPGAWRDLARELLGLEVPTDREGCMQDVHWSIGQWGYFPTYSLGNVYGAQLLEAARAELPDLDAHLARTGSTAPLVGWLDRNVYRHGCGMTSREVVEAATASPVASAALVRHLEARAAGQQ
jgi:carboxypeptidase Taq